jgi:hypothetical protein
MGLFVFVKMHHRGHLMVIVRIVSEVPVVPLVQRVEVHPVERAGSMIDHQWPSVHLHLNTVLLGEVFLVQFRLVQMVVESDLALAVA